MTCCIQISFSHLPRTGIERPISLGPPAIPPDPYYIRGYIPTNSEYAVSGSDLRVTAGSQGGSGALRRRRSPQSSGERTATALCSNSRTSGATTHGVAVRNRGASERCHDRWSAGRQQVMSPSDGEGVSPEVSRMLALERSTREESPLTRSTIHLNEEGTACGKAASGGHMGVGDGTSRPTMKKRRHLRNSGRGTPMHARSLTLRRKRN